MDGRSPPYTGADDLAGKYAGLRADHRPAANVSVVAKADLTADHAVVLDHHAAGDAGLCGDNAAFADLDVVTDLDQVVDLCSLPDPGFAQRPPVDAGVRSDLDMAKAGANYMNSQLIKMEAKLAGFSEGIALDERGYVSEGSGENIFLVNNGKLITPPLGAAILPGITRDTVIEIAREMGIEIVETTIQRAALYLADELFFTGTAAEISPIRSVDRIPVGNGKRGEMTRRIQEEFFNIILAKRPAPRGANWLTFIHSEKNEQPAAMGAEQTVSGS